MPRGSPETPPGPPGGGPPKSRRIACFQGLLLAGLVIAWGCASPTQVGKAAIDQDVARDVSWELRKDARLADVNALCTGGTVTLKGRVDSKAAEAEALRIAQSSSHGARVISELEIRPR